MSTTAGYLREKASFADELGYGDHARILEYVASHIATLEAQLAEAKAELKDALEDRNHAETKHMEFMRDIQAALTRRLSALEATPPAPKVTECATDGCESLATVRFERGGVGSEYCHPCYLRVQALTAAQEEGR